jgi:aspartyl aminopeptidase
MPLPTETFDLLSFIDASPTPWHAVATCEQRLQAAGWTRVEESDHAWLCAPGDRGYVVKQGGSIVAWKGGTKSLPEAGFRAIGAHTDSPNLRIKPNPDRPASAGCATLGLEPYGGVLLATWMDRDLGVAGRVAVRSAGGGLNVETRLLRVDQPLCRIPNLAIHLNRGVNNDGLVVDRNKHLPALWAMAPDGDEGGFRRWLAEELRVAADAILGWDLCLFDVVPSTLSGRDREFVNAPRLDNLGSCHAALSALLAVDEDAEGTALIALFDHEEIGSRTTRGAGSAFLGDVLGRLVGGSPTDLARAKAKSFLVSADMAHAQHPNFADYHDGQHAPRLNGGPVLKTHQEWRYATDAGATAVWRGLCADAGVPLQEFTIRSDLACGSTIGPIVTTALGIEGVDVGNPMLSMHSIREMCGSADQPLMIRAMTAFLGWSRR